MLSNHFLPGTGTPPPIPGARSVWDGYRRRAMVYWVRTGAAHVRLDDAGAFRLTAGEGIWIPADGWTHREIVTEPGTVAFPLASPLAPVSGAEPMAFDVPDAWQDWLIQHFNLMVTPLRDTGYSQDRLLALLRGAGTRPPGAPHRGSPPASVLEPPSMPKTGGARAAAEELLRDPALDLTVDEWAARVLSSPRTLRRTFLADTGLTFEQWRQRCRLSAAVEFLVAGYGVDQVAARVGFASRNGFTRAFKQQFGATPHEFSRELPAHPTVGGPSQRVLAARQADSLLQLVRWRDTPIVAPETIPPTRTAPHTNDVHVLSWVYRGSGYLDIGDRRLERRQGVATWIPAGVEHVTGLHQGSISLPIGTVGTDALQLTEPLQASFSRAWDDYLMFCAISARSRLRSDDYDPTHILGLFEEQLATQRALTVPMPTDPRAREAATQYLRHIGTSWGSDAFDVPAPVHRVFREQTGMTFSRWSYAARMRMARDLLAGGAKPSAVARRVGYAHLPTFSTAFSRFHGLSPREYQEHHLVES
ncbi:helix-turn-helix transcriptional regulator [Tessaracoccus caeni]|uniref:helix-turn-helix transcriptional regulator n=1 Tax=Tessaracoccus caeni TaxID=3031239 RepID=UPI0023DAE7D0|nr:helix-turn-helix domain-containing protein [Tessaracoccus caeni]MDF1487100.1 helix-turn-helix domain-containing protein [Tessaracoccus caeni]